MPGRPKAGRTPSRGSTPRAKRSSYSRCRRSFHAPTSTHWPSTRTASCGSPVRTGSTGAPIPEPAGSMRGRRRKVRVLTASLRHRLATSASLAGDHIAKIDTATGAATVVEPPKPGVGPRRIWSDSKGMLWVSFWHAGAIGRYDPATKAWATYPMPQSKWGTYSIYVDDRDRVWATDWAANAVQRFDPKAGTYTTFPSDKKNANVRQMLGRPGEAWGGESGTDRLVVIRD